MLAPCIEIQNVTFHYLQPLFYDDLSFVTKNLGTEWVVVKQKLYSAVILRYIHLNRTLSHKEKYGIYVTKASINFSVRLSLLKAASLLNLNAAVTSLTRVHSLSNYSFPC